MRAEILGRNAKIKIGENVSIGQNFHVVSYDDNLTIGNNVTISANVFISNCEHGYMEIGKHILEQPLLKKHTKIGDNCFIGYGAVILSGSILGKQCIIGANSVVRGVFPDYCVIVGNPARIVKKYNVEHQCWEKVGINL
ncbi:acyltransferase [Clostridium perfringens]|nr:acyltransferase [Clostridium perfringens]